MLLTHSLSLSLVRLQDCPIEQPTEPVSKVALQKVTHAKLQSDKRFVEAEAERRACSGDRSQVTARDGRMERERRGVLRREATIGDVEERFFHDRDSRPQPAAIVNSHIFEAPTQSNVTSPTVSTNRDAGLLRYAVNVNVMQAPLAGATRLKRKKRFERTESLPTTELCEDYDVTNFLPGGSGVGACAAKQEQYGFGDDSVDNGGRTAKTAGTRGASRGSRQPLTRGVTLSGSPDATMVEPLQGGSSALQLADKLGAKTSKSKSNTDNTRDRSDSGGGGGGGWAHRKKHRRGKGRKVYDSRAESTEADEARPLTKRNHPPPLPLQRTLLRHAQTPSQFQDSECDSEVGDLTSIAAGRKQRQHRHDVISPPSGVTSRTA